MSGKDKKEQSRGESLPAQMRELRNRVRRLVLDGATQKHLDELVLLLRDIRRHREQRAVAETEEQKNRSSIERHTTELARLLKLES